jgi:hypothetical protein
VMSLYVKYFTRYDFTGTLISFRKNFRFCSKTKQDPTLKSTFSLKVGYVVPARDGGSCSSK